MHVSCDKALFRTARGFVAPALLQRSCPATAAEHGLLSCEERKATFRF
jgi:hypothetical protein